MRLQPRDVASLVQRGANVSDVPTTGGAKGAVQTVDQCNGVLKQNYIITTLIN